MTRVALGVLAALLAALLFGFVNVAAKTTSLHPVAKSGLAYLVAGLVLAPTLRGARFQRHEWPLVLGVALVGGALAPVLLFVGLTQAAASTASFLLTLEMAFTALLAFLFLRERTRGAALAGLGLLFLAALLAVLAAGDTHGETTLLGGLLVLLAALGWGVDNMLSARLVTSHAPHRLVAIKGLIGGLATLLLSLALGWRGEATLADVGAVAFIGLFGIAGSIVLFYHALQRIGATRTTGIFLPATSLTGATAGWFLLHETFRPIHAAAILLLLVGIVLVLRAEAQARPTA